MLGALPTLTLGATGLSVTPIGLGLAALGRPAYITTDRDRDLGADRVVETMERRSHAVLDAAYDAGIRYIDAARSYGRAEEFLASWLHARALPPGAVTVGSKWGYRYIGDWRVDAPVHEVKDHSFASFVDQRGETEAILGPYFRLYQVHSATIESGVFDDRSVLQGLAETSAAGVAVGLSTSGPRQGDVVRRALEVDIDGVNPFVCVQSTWNVLEPSVGPALAEAHDAGWGVLVKEVFANGRLTQGVEGRSALAGVAQARAVAVADVAMAAALAQPWVHVVLTGAVTPNQVRADVRASAIALTDDELRALTSDAERAEDYWHLRSSLPWR